MDEQRKQVIRALRMAGSSSESGTVPLERIDADIKSGTLPLASAAQQLADRLKGLRRFRAEASQLDDQEIREAVERITIDGLNSSFKWQMNTALDSAITELAPQEVKEARVAADPGIVLRLIFHTTIQANLAEKNHTNSECGQNQRSIAV